MHVSYSNLKKIDIMAAWPIWNYEKKKKIVYKDTHKHTYIYLSVDLYIYFFVYENTHKHIHTSLNWFGNVYSTKIKGKKDKLWSTLHRTLKKHKLHKYQVWTQGLWKGKQFLLHYLHYICMYVNMKSYTIEPCYLENL